MKKYNNYILLGFLLFLLPTLIIAQQDTIQRLKEVQLSDVKLQRFEEGNKLIKISDSTLTVTTTNLGNLLRFNSNLSIREVGIGGTSSVSFRGTTASQTAVIWNGLNINSQLNGQTDFNTINVRNYDKVTIKTGGGSVGYGSGAVGGTIHLNSDFEFKKHISNRLITSLGSYNTVSSNYRFSTGAKKFFTSLGIDHNDSANDYTYLGQKGKENENGEFRNYNVNVNGGIFIADKHVLKFFNNTYIGFRNFSGSLFSPSNSSYRDNNTRTLFKYIYLGNKFTSELSLAYLYEKYRFFSNKENKSNYSFGRSRNTVFKYDFNYKFSNSIQLKTVFQYENILGNGSDIESEERKIGSLAFLFSHKVNSRLNYGFNLRQEVNDFDSFSFNSFFEGVKETYNDVTGFSATGVKTNQNPFILSLGGSYAVSSFYTVKLNASKNFRTPTFNDLYWNGAGGIGNIDLKSEKSIQAEWVNEFKHKGINLNITGFYIKSKDLINWIPLGNSIWTPINVDKVYNYGAEIEFSYAKEWGENELVFSSNYNYTVSEDQETDFQIIFKPKQLATFSLAYNYKKWSTFYQLRWNDETFITTDNKTKLDAYDVSNIGLNYKVYNSDNKDYNIGLSINNIYNEIYFLDPARPAPNRNYKLQLILKF